MDTSPKDQDWIEFNLIVGNEYVDRVRIILADILPNGLIEERIYEDLFPAEILKTTVPVRISAYIPVNDDLDVVKMKITTALRKLSRVYPIPEPNFKRLTLQDWTKTWQENYQPIPVGDQLIIVPSWLDNPQSDRLEITMDPGMAFGSGTHPTTQLCLVLLERFLEENSVQRMIDIGCGSGILAIAGAKLGVEKILGVDIDQDAIRVASNNAVLNQIEDSIVFQKGSVKEILEDHLIIKSASLVTANIIAPILCDLFETGLDQVVDPGGTILLSGVLENQLPQLFRRLYELQLKVVETEQDGDWIALQVLKPC